MKALTISAIVLGLMAPSAFAKEATPDKAPAPKPAGHFVKLSDAQMSRVTAGQTVGVSVDVLGITVNATVDLGSLLGGIGGIGGIGGL